MVGLVPVFRGYVCSFLGVDTWNLWTSSIFGFEPSKRRPFHSIQNKGPHLGSRYIYIYMDLSKNRGTPKWMVKIMENPNKMDDLGGTIIFGNTHIYTHPKTNQSSGSSINVDHSVFFRSYGPMGMVLTHLLVTSLLHTGQRGALILLYPGKILTRLAPHKS